MRTEWNTFKGGVWQREIRCGEGSWRKSDHIGKWMCKMRKFHIRVRI